MQHGAEGRLGRNGRLCDGLRGHCCKLYHSMPIVARVPLPSNGTTAPARVLTGRRTLRAA